MLISPLAPVDRGSTGGRRYKADGRARLIYPTPEGEGRLELDKAEAAMLSELSDRDIAAMLCAICCNRSASLGYQL